MKKKSFLFLLGIFAVASMFVGCASIEGGTIPLERRKIIEVPNTNQSALFVKCNSAAVELFNDASSVIQYSDKDAGIIKGKFIISNLTSGIYYYKVDVVITIEIKDTKVRLTCSGMTATLVGDAWSGYYPSGRQSFTVKEETSIAEKVNTELLAFEQSFIKKLNTTDTNW